MNTDTLFTKIGMVLIFSPLIYVVARCLEAWL